MKNKIIHIVLGKANPNRMNGVNRVVHFLSNALTEIGKKVEVWGLSGDQDLDNTYERNYNLRVFLFGSKYDNKELFEAIKKERNVVFHFHGGFIPVFVKLAKSIKKQGDEYVFTPHGCYTEGAMQKNKWKKKLFFTFYDNWLLKNAKAVQGLGYQESRDMKKLVSSANIVSIANGQEKILIDNIEVNNKPDLVFGYCGRLDRNHKGLDLLIDGFISFKKKSSSNIKLWIVGGGDYESEMKRKVHKAKINGEVKFFGPKYGDEKFELISQMNVFFHTSRHEGLPTAVLEACHLGVPCAVTPQTSFDRFVVDYNTGWKIQELTSKAVYETMQQIVNESSSLSTKSINSINMIKNMFSWSKIAKEIIRIY